MLRPMSFGTDQSFPPSHPPLLPPSPSGSRRPPAPPTPRIPHAPASPPTQVMDRRAPRKKNQEHRAVGAAVEVRGAPGTWAGGRDPCRSVRARGRRAAHPVPACPCAPGRAPSAACCALDASSASPSRCPAIWTPAKSVKCKEIHMESFILLACNECAVAGRDAGSRGWQTGLQGGAIDQPSKSTPGHRPLPRTGSGPGGEQARPGAAGVGRGEERRGWGRRGKAPDRPRPARLTPSPRPRARAPLGARPRRSEARGASKRGTGTGGTAHPSFRAGRRTDGRGTASPP